MQKNAKMQSMMKKKRRIKLTLLEKNKPMTKRLIRCGRIKLSVKTSRKN